MKLHHTLEGHEGQVSCARFGPEGRRVATGARDKTIGIWSLRGKLERSLEGHRRAVTALGFTATGELISADGAGIVRVWSWPKGKLIHELAGHRGPVYTLGSSPDGSLIASGARDETVCVWSTETGELLWSLDVGPRGMALVFSGDGEHLVTGRRGDTLCFWSLETGELAWEQQAGPGTVGAFEPDRSGEWVVSRGWRGPITIWSATAWGYTAVLPIVEKGLTGATLRPGHEQVVCCYEGGLGIYDAEDGAVIDAVEIDCKGIYDLDVSPDGRYAVTASADELARIWDMEGV
ncbi:MAG: WD40 repeat domain-containing protein [Enhygromyxa sp.]